MILESVQLQPCRWYQLHKHQEPVPFVRGVYQAFIFPHTGHPDPLCRSPIRASHSCPFGQSHQIFFPEPQVTSFGVTPLLFVGCHCLAMCGRTRSWQLSALTLFPEQNGHPVPKWTLLEGLTCHSWPFWQRHHTLVLEEGVT
jgi:hypothetical protein